MPFLQNEKSRLQAEVQAAAAEIVNLTARQQDQQNAVSAAQGRVAAAQARLADARAQLAPLQAAADAADSRAAQATEAIDAHLANEPDPMVEVPNKPPRPNPAWTAWNRALERLQDQLGQAEADSSTAQVRLNEGTTRVSQATTDVQVAERQVGDATNALHVTQQAIAAARQRQETAQGRVAEVDRWNDEIARDQLDRNLLEPVAAELSNREAVLDDAHAEARVQNEIAEETLSSLTASRDRLTPARDQVNAQLPAALEELRAAKEALAAVTRSVQLVRRRGPRS